MSKKLNQLSQTITKFDIQIKKKITEHNATAQQLRDKINQIQQQIQQKTNYITYKIEDLKKKQSILVIINKIEPLLPERFPKNFQFILNYEDVVLTGNQKFLDFQQQQTFDEKFIVPLLERSSQLVKIEVWGTEQDRTIFDYAEIDFQKQVEMALQTKKNENQRIKFIKNPEFYLSYSIILQGIGFESWLKNIELIRDMQQQLKFEKKQNEANAQIKYKKFQEKAKSKISKIKKNQIRKIESYEQSYKQINTILQALNDEEF